MNLDKLEQQLYEIEQQIKGTDLKNVENIQKKLQKKLKYLKCRKSKFKKDEVEYSEIKQVIATITRLKKIIARQKNPLYSLENFPLYHLDSNKVIDTFDTIVNINLPKEEKIYFLQIKIYELEQQIEKISKQISFLQKRKKEALEIVKDYSQVHKIEQMIRENEKNKYELKEMIRKCKSAILSLKDVRVNYRHQKRSKIKENPKQEHNEYYQILVELFDNEENYYFIKNLIIQNKQFLNARKNGNSILLEILDRFILNSKKALMNQKLEFQNPDFYFGLFKEFLNHDVNLTSKEKETIDERIKKFLSYVNKKKYKDYSEICNAMRNLISEKDNQEFHTYFDAHCIETFKKDSLHSNRANLTKEYLEKLNKQITEVQEEYFTQYGQMPTIDVLEKLCHCKIFDIHNSQYISSTFYLEGQKYAFSYGYDREYNTYLRIHVFDTTFVSEDSNLYREMTNYKKGKSESIHSILSFRNGEQAPAFTYQLKILKNGRVSSFKMFNSIIKVDRVIKNKDWFSYREDGKLKHLAGLLHIISQDYNIEESYLNNSSVEQTIDTVLNAEIKRIIEKNNLPTLYAIHKNRKEEDMVREYGKVCQYLSKISREEVEEFYNLFVQSKTYEFYSTVPMYETHVFLDPSSLLGYLELFVLKAYTRGVSTKQIEEQYLPIFKELETELNQEDTYMKYQTKKYLEKVK